MAGTSPSVTAGFSRPAPSVVEDVVAVGSLGRGILAGSLGPELPFWALLALRKSPENPPCDCFFPSPSVSSSPDVVPVRRSFLVPRLLKNEDRRLSVGVVVAPGVVDPAAVAGASEATVPVVGSVGLSVTGFSSWGAVFETVDGSSFVATLGAVSAVVGVAAGSFLPKRPPKRDARLFGFGAVSLVPEAGAASEVTGAAVVFSTLLAGADSTTPAVSPPAGKTGSPTTREATRVSEAYEKSGAY